MLTLGNLQKNKAIFFYFVTSFNEGRYPRFGPLEMNNGTAPLTNTQDTVTTNITVEKESPNIGLRLTHKNTVLNCTRAGFREENQEVIKVGSDMR